MRRNRPQPNQISIAAVIVLALVASLNVSIPQRMVSALPLAQDETPQNCRQLDRALIEFEVSLPYESENEAGRVLSANDGTLAAIVILRDVSADGAITSIDYAASVRANAIILHSGDGNDLRAFDPPVRSGSGLHFEDNRRIDSLSFCYTVSIPAPPQASTSEPDVERTEPAISPTTTVLTIDLGPAQTAQAQLTEIAATATRAASDSANALASAEAESAAIAATATAAAEMSSSSDAELAATIAAQVEAIASAEAEVASARQTVEALQATISAPTATSETTATAVPSETAVPTETPTPEPSMTATLEPTPTNEADALVFTVVYETSGKTPFADWQPVNGWDLGGEVARTDGSGDRGWLVVPVPSGLSVDAMVEVEFRVIGGEVCPRNFGIGMRGSATGFYAAGIEWACDSGLVMWAGSEVLPPDSSQPILDPGGEWHTLRISTVGDVITVLIDDTEIARAEDDQYPTGNLVAFWTDRVGLEIRHVRVSEVSS